MMPLGACAAGLGESRHILSAVRFWSIPTRHSGCIGLADGGIDDGHAHRLLGGSSRRCAVAGCCCCSVGSRSLLELFIELSDDLFIGYGDEL